MDVQRLIVHAERIAGGAPGLARVASGVPRLAVWRSSRTTAPAPAFFEPKFYMLLQGRKRMVVRGRQVDYAAGRYAVSAVGIPFTTQVTQASAAAPYIGVELVLDTALVAGLLVQMPQLGTHDGAVVDTAQATDDIVDALERLLRLSADPASVPALAPLYERELHYRLLCGPVGGTMRQAVKGHARFAQVRAAVEWICGHADEPMVVDRLAASVDMSTTSFHRHFKAVTSFSPLAYQRHVRLLAAREQLLAAQANVTAVAHACGYASASQFSREYKRMFGVPPVHDADGAAWRGSRAIQAGA